MKIDFSKFDKYKVEYIKRLSESNVLKAYCNEIWIFGSVVNNYSLKSHTSYSDIDIGIFPKVKDLRSTQTQAITNEIRNILNTKIGGIKRVNRDIAWILDEDDYMINEIKRGVRII